MPVAPGLSWTMRVLIDANILVSAVMFPHGLSRRALIMTGDKDLLEAGLTSPRAVDPRSWLSRTD